MKTFFYTVLFSLALLSADNCLADVEAAKQPQPVMLSSSDFPNNSPSAESSAPALKPDPRLRGWDYLVHKLEADDLETNRVRAIYSDSRMPRFTPVTFSLEPKESHSIYSNFLKFNRIKQARQFLREHKQIFEKVRKVYGVNGYVITSILLVETHFGKVTGR